MSFLFLEPNSAGLMEVFRAYPETSKPLIEYHEILLRGPSPFTAGERELIAAYVSTLNRCNFCSGVHVAASEKLGVPSGTVSQLVADVSLSAAPEKMRPVLRYAEKLTREPASVTQMDADAIFSAGWDRTALFHTVAVTALFNFMNRLVEGMGVRLPPGYVDTASTRLAEQGYLPLLDMIKR